MKPVILLLLPLLVIAAPEKRYVLDTLTKLINTDTIKKDLQLMIDLVGSDPTEQACEQAGHQYLSGLLDHAVPLICHSFQELVQHFHVVPSPTTTAAAPGKRYVLDTLTKFINTETIKADLQKMIDIVGSDPTEQACEQAGHQYLAGLLDHAVPLICHSFQELVQHFHIVPSPTTTAAAPGKRYVLDTINKFIDTETIKKDLQLMIDLVGSDPTEQACEQAGHQYLSGLLDHAVPLICHSFQELVHHFHIAPSPTTTAAAPGKRYVLDTLTKFINTETIKADLQKMIDIVGSDPTEQACEQAGHQYLAGLLDHAVPLICHSFQELVQHFHIVPSPTTTAAAPGKRYVLDTINKFINTETIKADLQKMIDIVGSDPTEQACEQAGHQYLAGLLDHAVPLICHSFQELIQHFHIVPSPTTTAAAPGKRYVLDTINKFINTETIKADLQKMIDIVGSDPTEQACEQAGHQYLAGLLDHAVPLICHSFQELIQHFHIVPSPTTTAAAPGKRYVLDTINKFINTETIKADLQKMIDIVGSDPTEQACEQAGHQYLAGLLDHAVPLICHSFQELIQHFHIVPSPTTTVAAPGKRYVLDTLNKFINTETIKKDLQLLIDVVGSDPTEQACEQAGHQYLAGLLDHAVPLICHSFQELVQHFHIVPATTTTASVK